MRRIGLLVFPLLIFGSFLWAQEEAAPETVPAAANLSGPRLGMTCFVNGVPEGLDTLGGGPYTTQFGYYFEYQFHRTEKITLATDVVFLLGGMERGLFFPSLTWAVGFRTASQIEIGVGPNFVPYEGLGYTIAIGKTFTYGKLLLPLNIALVLSDGCQRITFLTGFAGEIRL